LQIGGLEPFSEASVHGGQQIVSIADSALIAQQPSKARGSAQFPGQRTLPAPPIKRLPEMILGPAAAPDRPRKRRSLNGPNETARWPEAADRSIASNIV
jgi:hypothetical protein